MNIQNKLSSQSANQNTKPSNVIPSNNSVNFNNNTKNIDFTKIPVVEAVNKIIITNNGQNHCNNCN